MDDYMKEMMDLKTLVTKTLEKKGVLARIRAELRANVFQAIEEQDRVSESEGSESFALLGRCNQRAKELHATPAGKLLTGLVCEYLEWCELDRTMKVYLPELNQPRPYSRSELEELLEIKSEKNNAGVSSESRPLLLEVLDDYLKSEQTSFVKDSYAVSSSSFPKSSRTSAGLGLKPSMNGLDKGDEDLRGAFESRLTMSNKVVDHMTPLDNSVGRGSGGVWYSEICSPYKDPGSSLRSGINVTPAINKLSTNRHDESLKDKPTARISLLGDLPPISGRGGLPPVILSNSSVRGNGILSPAGSNSFVVSASGVQIGNCGRGGLDGGNSSLKTEPPSQVETTDVKPKNLGSRRVDFAGNVNKEPSESSNGENRTQLQPRELSHDLNALSKGNIQKVSVSKTAGTLDNSNSRGLRGGDFTGEGNVEASGDTVGEIRMQILQRDLCDELHEFQKDDILHVPCPESANTLRRAAVSENSQGTAKEDQNVGCVLSPPGENISCVKTKCEDLCSSHQVEMPQMLTPVGDRSTTLRERSVSAYFYSESDDDVSVPVEEGFNGGSDEESDAQF